MKSRLFIGLALFLVMAACHSPQREARQMVRRAERLFDTMPDSTFKLIDSILRMPVYFNEKQRMDMALLQGGALFGDRGQEIPPLMDDEFFDDKPFLSTSPELERAADYYARKKNYAKAAHAALYSGFIQQHYNEKQAAMQSFKDAERYGEMVKDSLTVARAEYWMGRMLYEEGMEQEALAMLMNSEQRFGFRHKKDEAMVQNMLAVCYLVLGDFESAENSLNRSLALLKNDRFDKVKRKALNNYAVLFRLQGRYDQAAACLRLIKNEPHLDDTELLLFHMNLGDVFVETNDMDSAAFYYRIVDSLLPIAQVKKETKVSAYKALSRFEEIQHNDSLALYYWRYYDKWLNDIRDQQKRNNIYGIQKKYDYGTLQNVMSQKVIQRQRLIIILSIVAALISFAFAISQIRLVRIRKQEAEAKANLFHFMQQNEELKSQVGAMKQDFHLSQQALQQRMMEIYKSGEENKLERILSEFSAVYPQAMKKLATRHPELNESERNIVVLSFLGFRTKEEADILGLSLNTVEKYRTNIRKKAKNNPFPEWIG